MHKGSAKTWLPFKGVTLLLKATLPTCVLSHRGLSLLQHAPRSSPYDTSAGSHTSCGLTRNGGSQTTACEAGVQQYHGCAPFRLHRIRWVSVKAWARMSCNRRNGYCVQGNRTATRPMPRLLDCGTSTATRGSPARDLTVPIECNDHGSVSRGERHDGRYGQKWADSNCSSRRAEAAVKSPAGSHPLLKRQESPLPRHEDDTPMFRSSNDSRTRPPCESPVPSH